MTVPNLDVECTEEAILGRLRQTDWWAHSMGRDADPRESHVIAMAYLAGVNWGLVAAADVYRGTAEQRLIDKALAEKGCDNAR